MILLPFCHVKDSLWVHCELLQADKCPIHRGIPQGLRQQLAHAEGSVKALSLGELKIWHLVL